MKLITIFKIFLLITLLTISIRADDKKEEKKPEEKKTEEKKPDAKADEKKTESKDAKAEEKVGTQVSAYPNTSSPPTAADQLDKVPKVSSPLSKALDEVDPIRSLKKNEFVQELKYGLHQLTRGEAEQIFDFVDVNKKDIINIKDWSDFVALFILPFEACDTDKNKLLNEEEFKKCFNSDPHTKLVEFRRRYNETKIGIILDTITTRGRREINYSDYLFYRKALYGWSQCHSAPKYIAIAHFRCVLGVAVLNKYHLKMVVENIYNVGLQLSDRNLVELDFIGYLRITYFTYVFTVFSAPHDLLYLEKTQWINVVKEDRLPNNFEGSEINYI